MLNEEWNEVFKNARLFRWSVKCSDDSDFTWSTSSWFSSSLWFSFSNIRSIRSIIRVIIIICASNIIIDVNSSNFDWLQIIIIIISINIILIASSIVSIVFDKTSNERYEEENSHQNVEQDDHDPDCCKLRWIIFRNFFVWPNKVAKMSWGINAVLALKTSLIITMFDFIEIEHLNNSIHKVFALLSIRVELNCAAYAWINFHVGNWSPFTIRLHALEIYSHFFRTIIKSER